MVRKSGEWVVHAGFIDLEEPQNQCLLTQDHFQHKLPMCPWASRVTLLSLQGQVPHAWEQAGGSGLGSFSFALGGWCSRLCCSSAMWSRAAPAYLRSCAHLRSQAQYLRMSCRIWDYLYALVCPNVPLNEDPSVHCPSAGSEFLQEGDCNLWAKGDLSYNSPSAHWSHLGHEGIGVQIQPQSCSPSRPGR